MNSSAALDKGCLGWDLPPLQILDKPDNRKLFFDRKRFYPVNQFFGGRHELSITFPERSGELGSTARLGGYPPVSPMKSTALGCLYPMLPGVIHEGFDRRLAEFGGPPQLIEPCHSYEVDRQFHQALAKTRSPKSLSAVRRTPSVCRLIPSTV
jgi:hypothetical protein